MYSALAGKKTGVLIVFSNFKKLGAYPCN